MLALNVVAFAGVAAHVVERQREFVPFGHLARASAVAGRECFVTAARMGEHEFVASVAHGFQAVFPVVEQERRARRGVRHALEQAADAYAVDLLRRERRARDLREGRQQVDGRGQLVADRSGGRRPRPPHDARHALPAFEGGSLAFAKTARRAGVVAVVDPRPVVRSEHDDRIGGRAALFQRLEHFAHAPVDLHHHVAVQSLLAFALELVRDEERHVRHGVGQVEEERAFGPACDEVDGMFRVPGGELRLVRGRDRRVDDLAPFVQRQRRIGRRLRMVGPHVVGVGQPEVFVETVVEGHKPRAASHVPFADDGGCVAGFLQVFGHGLLVGVESCFRFRTERPGESDAVGVASRQKPGARSAADSLGAVIIGEAHAFGAEPVDVGRPVSGGPRCGQVAVAHVVEVDEHDVRRLLSGAFRVCVGVLCRRNSGEGQQRHAGGRPEFRWVHSGRVGPCPGMPFREAGTRLSSRDGHDISQN